MSKKTIIQKAREEGYKKGLEAGFKLGVEQAQVNATNFFAKRFEGLEKVPGIGPKTVKLFVEHFGKEYFREVKK